MKDKFVTGYTVSPFSAIQQRNGGKIPASGPGGSGPPTPVKCTVLDHDTVRPQALSSNRTSLPRSPIRYSPSFSLLVLARSISSGNSPGDASS